MRRSWLVLLILIVLGVLLWQGGRHLWAWYHYRAGRSDLERYHSEEALAHLNACLEVWPGSATAHLLACRAARRTQDFEQARQHLHECQRLEGQPSTDSTLEEALLDAAMGKLDKVAASLESWLDREPALGPLIWEALVEGYTRMYRVRDALSCLDRWLEAEPENVQAFFLRGNIWRHIHSGRRAVPDYRRVVKRDPERRDARKWLAFSLMQIGQFQEAVKHLEALRGQPPQDPEVLVRLARCKSKLGQLGPARRLIDEVLGAHPGDWLALRTRGQLALLERQPAEAERWLRRAVRAWGHDYESQYALYLALVQQGKNAAARAQSKTAEQLKKRLERMAEIQNHEMSSRPHDARLHCELGTLLLQLGHTEIGLRWLHSALHQDPPNYAPAHAALADYHAAHGQPDQAAYHREQARSTSASSSKTP
jgi:tetratricopeptide (TPR) repeat protein